MVLSFSPPPQPSPLRANLPLYCIMARSTSPPQWVATRRHIDYRARQFHCDQRTLLPDVDAECHCWISGTSPDTIATVQSTNAADMEHRYRFLFVFRVVCLLHFSNNQRHLRFLIGKVKHHLALLKISKVWLTFAFFVTNWYAWFLTTATSGSACRPVAFLPIVNGFSGQIAG